MVGSLFGGSERASWHEADLDFDVRDDDPYDDDVRDDEDDDDATNDDDDILLRGDDDDSMASMTVPSATDERTAASILAHRNQERLFYKKLTIIVCFVFVAIFVSVAVYGFANSESKRTIEEEFDSCANELMKVATIKFENVVSKTSTFALTITGLTNALKDTWPLVSWPFVKITDFEAHASNYLKETPEVQWTQMAMYVNQNQRLAWEAYATSPQSQAWIPRGYAYLGLDPSDVPDITPFIYQRYPNGTKYREDNIFANIEDEQGDHNAVYTPLWMGSPTNVVVDDVNYNAIDNPIIEGIYNYLKLEKKGSPYAISPPLMTNGETSSPQSMMGTPIYEGFQDTTATVSMLLTSMTWATLFTDILNAEDSKQIDMFLEDTCNMQSLFAYSLKGPLCTFIGVADKSALTNHPQNEFGGSGMMNITTTKGCNVRVHMLPSTEFVDSSTSNSWVYAVAIIAMFVIMFGFFIVYDRCLNNQSPNNKMGGFNKSMAFDGSKRRSTKETSFVNPDESAELMTKPSSGLTKSRHGGGGGGALKAMMEMPIADLHPNATVLFADIAHFMAWSSVREPSQVFMLLETVFSAYDKLAKKYKVYKVETIGDSYVAVTGLPEACPDHAVLMARFAHEALLQMRAIVKQLEVVLGPDTAELAMRVGLHSGPVTAGVLRGEKSRFQLFGATVNTASTIESTGKVNRIHVSSDTAEQIRLNGFEHWLVKRDTKVPVKGRGEIETYWVNITNSPLRNQTGSESPPGDGRSQMSLQRQRSMMSLDNPDQKIDRLVNWSTDLLLGLLKRIIAMRESEEELKEQREFEAMVQQLDEQTEMASRITNIDGLSVSSSTKGRKEPKIFTLPEQTVLDEVKEIITLPRKVQKFQQDPNLVPISQNVINQLTEFVSDIAHMYRDNPFHNFEHASHVTQSLTKLLSRVVTENEIDYENLRYKKKAGTSKLHKFTFGITSDPITQFAVAFSSIIHDLDHPGVPNAVLVKEETRIAKMYKDKSVAEQNSVDLAWSLLMEPRFKDLRSCIYKTQSELDRFRQLVVNSVMATDIVDKELGALRKKRWEKAFNKDGNEHFDEEARDEVNRKATIVIEHLIQAADVAHTMQHWHVYLKWNERFFHECYQVYLSGRSETDPSDGWYKGEIGFFDFYIIPLARKLESCGVFGVSSDECLQYATANRNEWERKGKEIVAGYLSAYDKVGRKK